MNYWVVTFFSVMYLSSFGMCSWSPKPKAAPKIYLTGTVIGILLAYEISRPMSHWDLGDIINFGIAYYPISLALNLLLTLMIVIRLALHSREFRKALGAPDTARGLYTTVIATLVESATPYTVSFLLYIGPWLAGTSASDIFSILLPEAQVRVSSTSPLVSC